MELKMFIGDKLIDVIAINATKLNLPGYVHSLRMDMEEKNEAIIDLSEEEPKFFIDKVPSAMNKNRFLSGNSVEFTLLE
jgi:hypothetical protein